MTVTIWATVGLVHATACLLTFGAYWLDKRAAQRGRRRVPERTLHLLELSGGWAGGLLARSLLRHKTMALRFRAVSLAIILLHAVAWGAWLWLRARG